MQNGVELVQKMVEIAFEIKAAGYSTDELPAWFYSDCKKMVNWFEGFSRDASVRPSTLKSIRFRGGKRVAVVDRHSKKAKKDKEKDKEKQKEKERGNSAGGTR